ncbi:protein Shroom3 isoform X2 [Lepisosteus oculatus]|uniref:protein Shroom3 isoform X2 n=1 Tax=Lepisosteus oculatus TaxID=7918 RepID=UPI0037134DE0
MRRGAATRVPCEEEEEEVEEGGKASHLQHRLQPGDQVVNINDVELSGSRQEAVSLVKGSYKTLRLTVRREGCGDDHACGPAALSTPSLPLDHAQCQDSQPAREEGVKLRVRSRRSEPASRPHSWHSTKLAESQQDPGMMQISRGTVGTPWHQTYHSSSSTTDLSGYEHGFLRKSPDQYSSRGSMESLDHSHPVYSSCHQLTASKSSNSIDHLHSKRDSAYSSFSTSSSIPEYPAPAFSKERSYSMENMHSQRGPEGMRQADIRYVRTVYDPQQGISEEHEVSSSALARSNEARIQAEARGDGIVRSMSNEKHASSRHSVGPVWGQTQNRIPDESAGVTGPPAPPMRSDSYVAIKNHDRPNSWSSLEQARSSRTLQKGSWPHPGISGKSSFSAEGQLHTVVEKSPESSPTTKPKQNIPQATQPGKLMLPTGIYPVPQMEPHFAQAPTSCPSSRSLLYPVLAKETRCSSLSNHSTSAILEGAAKENGYQSNASTLSDQSPGFQQPKLFLHQKDKMHEEPETKCSHYKPHFKPGADVYVSQAERQEHGCVHTPQSAEEDRRDLPTVNQQAEERLRYPQGNEIPDEHKWKREPEQTRAVEGGRQQRASSLQNDQEHYFFPKGQAGFECGQMSYGSCRDLRIPYEAKTEMVSNQGSDLRDRPTIRHHSETGVWQQQTQPPWHENASAEVPRPRSPNSSRSKSDIATKRLSVLEKVNQIEQRKQNQQQPHSTNSHHGLTWSSRPSRGKNSFSSIEDIRHRLKISEGPCAKGLSQGKMQGNGLDGKHEGGLEDSIQQKYREQHFQSKPENKALLLQRSKSTFQLTSEENSKEFHWKDGLQDILGTFQDTSFNRAYRDSIKDAQSKVLRSTSFRRKDLSVNSPHLNRHLSVEQVTSNKTSTKPGGVSPHTPRERHVVTPEEVPPALPSTPAVGPSFPRICGRKRLTAEQKKRSYSEPEKINELGVSDASQKKGPQTFLFPETSVADRRKMFEPEGKSRSVRSPGVSRPELKHLQQTALAEYVERKTAHKWPGKNRPHSSYLQPYNFDSQSLSSASSLSSLQEQSNQWGPSADSHPRTRRVSSTLPPGLQGSRYLSGSLSRQFSYDISCSSHAQPDRNPEFCSSERELNKLSKGESLRRRSKSQYAPHQQQPEVAFERGSTARSSGKSASAEDLLEHSEKRPVPHHIRSRSSPSVETRDRDFVTGVNQPFGILSKQHLASAGNEIRQEEKTLTLRNDRYMANQVTPSSSSALLWREKPSHVDRQTPCSTSGAAPLGCATRRDSRGSTSSSWDALESLGHVTSSPPLRGSSPSLPMGLGGRFQGRAPEPEPSFIRQSSLDTNSSEETLKDVQMEACGPQTTVAPKTTSFRKAEQVPSSPQRLVRRSPIAGEVNSSSSETETPFSSLAHPLPSLRISESNLQFSPTSGFLHGDDEVFLQEPLCEPSSPALPFQQPVRETEITEDFPYPPPVIAEEQGTLATLSPTALPHPDRTESPDGKDFPGVTERKLSSSSTPNCPSDSTSKVSTTSPDAVISICEEGPRPPADIGNESGGLVADEDLCSSDEDLETDSPLLGKQEKSPEELRSELLAKEIVSKDKSLAHILDTSTMKTTMDLMEDIFPTGSLMQQQAHSQRTGRMVWRSSAEGDERKEEEPAAGEERSAGPSSELSRRLETDLDELDPDGTTDVNQKKVELMGLITQHLEALRGAKETLAAEQKRISGLGSTMEALVQDRCKPNECDKYRMFIGDLDKVVNLLLSLSGRLARVENALSAVGRQASAEEREALQQKRKALRSQHEDARELKENLDRRERVVLDILGGYLSPRQLRGYQHFVRTKSGLLIKQRELDDEIRLAEEQLQCLMDSLPAPCAPRAAAPCLPTTVTSL